MRRIENGQSELKNLIGQFKVQYFTYEHPRSTYESAIMWSDSIGQAEVSYEPFENFFSLLQLFYRERTVLLPVKAPAEIDYPP